MGNTRVTRRAFVLGSAAVLAGGVARAQSWPARPIRVIVGFPPGGLTDLYARAYGDFISQQVGHPLVIENRPGAGSIIACEAVAKAPADGYTFLFTISTAINQNRVLYKNLPYDPEKDFTFISAFGAGQLPLAVHKDVPARNAREFIEYARRNRTLFGTYSPGSYPHMVAQQMNKLYGTQIEAVHYKGEAPMWVDLSGGRVHAAIGSYQAMAPHVASGTARPIAVPTRRRAPKLPDVQTFPEQGFSEPVFTIEGWVGMLGPAGLPREIVQRVSKAILDGADTPRIRQVHDTFGIPEKPSTPEEFQRLVREEGPIWIALAKELGVTLD